MPPRSPLAATAAVLAALIIPGSAHARAPEPQPYGKHDAGGFLNILPPAQGANANALEIAAFEANGTYPPHTSDEQLDKYWNLVYAVGSNQGLSPAHLDDYYKDATFGVKPANVESTESPRGDVTIVHDELGVPHIYGSTRAGAEFGAGYAAAEDRLFFMDVLRHAARAQLSSFIGGSQAGMDESIWADTPYNEQDLTKQYERGDDLYGRPGKQLQDDSQSYTQGVNQFISEACTNPTKLPGEYGLIAPNNSICLPANAWKPEDIIAEASLIAGELGNGGGGELGNALSLQAAREQLGPRRGRRVWKDFKSFDDPEAPSTVHGTRFPYGQPPRHRKGAAMPDPGSVQNQDVVASSSESRASARSSSSGELGPDLLKPLRQHHSASNALLVSGRESKSGHPVAVMGPQVAYWSPQILMEQDIHAPHSDAGPPMDAEGSTFPGTNLFVQLGHGRDYAWSATSAGQDQIDSFAVKLCDPDGGQPTLDSDHYRYRGQCLPFEVLTRTNSWVPTPADQTEAGSETLTSLRTKLGIVHARGTISGKPYAFTELRSTYFHEVDPSALGFSLFNNPNKMDTPKEFMRAANYIGYTFNWFYINRHHIAYFNSGQNPVRAPHVDPNLPTLGKKRFLWRKWNPSTATEAVEPLAAHAHVTDQRYLTSWNNRQAPGYNVGYSSIYRSQMLDEQVRPDIAGSKKIDLAQLANDMETAGTVDLRGDRSLPWALKVIRTKRVHDPQLRDAVATLRAWERSGAHRRDLDQNGTYDQAGAVRIMDAWWPRLVRAEFEPTLGSDLLGRLVGGGSFDDDNRTHGLGSAFQGSVYGYVAKDLRDLLGEHVRGPYSRVYCGGGKVGKCRDALLSSLSDALQHDSDADLYGTDTCPLGRDPTTADPQMCGDRVSFSAIGAITQPDMPWINRPTFQQAVELHK
jgi:acyl-homoserine lactone acylase PvdQ